MRVVGFGYFVEKIFLIIRVFDRPVTDIRR